MDERRLKLEVFEMRHTRGLEHFQLGEIASEAEHTWSRYFWLGTVPTGHTLRLTYSPDYPQSGLKVECHPSVKSIHHLGKRLCLMKQNEWNPDYTAATVITITMRFLRLYTEGKVF
jgi:hypothetical protein